MALVKSGYIKRHSKNLFSGGWGDVWVNLYQDSYLHVFKKQGDRDPKARICMKNVCKHFAYGQHAARNFSDMPQLPSGASIDHVLAVPEKQSHKAKPHWFLCDNEQHLHEWMSAICSTLPTRPQKSQEQRLPAQTTHHMESGPPGYMPGPPQPQPPGIGFSGVAPPSGQYQQPYPQQPPPYQQAPAPYPQQPGPYPPQPGPYPQQPGYAPPYQPQYGAQQVPYAGQQGYGYQPPPGQYGYQQPQGYAQQPNVVYGQDHKKGGSGGLLGGLGGLGAGASSLMGGGRHGGRHGKGGGILSSNKGKMAAGLVGGAALGYGASRMFSSPFGGGFGGGGFGMGRCGSWSSMSSFGSCGSFGSFGSFD